MNAAPIGIKGDEGVPTTLTTGIDLNRNDVVELAE